MLKTANCSLFVPAASFQVVSSDRPAEAGLPASSGNGLAVSSFRLPAQMLRIMRMISFLLVAACLSAHANGVAQTVTLSGKDLTLKQVFSAIKKQTGYVVVNKKGFLDDAKSVSLTVFDMPLADLLQAVLKDQPVKFAIQGKTIILSRKAPGPASSQVVSSDRPVTLQPITGIILDEDGNPLVGVTITIKGSKTSTSTDDLGRFSLNAAVGDVLTFTSIGFESQSFTIKNTSTISITLNKSTSILDEVQIKAYGTTSRRLSTASITTIKSEDIAKQPINNPLYALQGRAPGLQVTPSSGLAGAAVDVEIRGRNSLNPGGAPLIVIDGLPVINNISGLGHANLSSLSALSFLNPYEIESISVLKDADATSVYGSRGANGVILITTKKGKAGETKVDINIQSGWGHVPKKINLLKTDEYISLRKEAFNNVGVDFINTFPYGNPDYKYLLAPDLFVWDSKRYTDWQSKLIGGNASYNDFQGNISGGSPTMKYIIGGNYHRETTVFRDNNSDRKGSAHINLVGNSQNQKFSTSITASYMLDKNTLPGIDFTKQAITLAPNAPQIYKDNGQLNWEVGPTGNVSWENPYSELFKTYEAKLTNLITSLSIQYNIFNALTLKAQGGYSDLKGSSFRKFSPFEGRNPENTSGIGGAGFNSNSVTAVSFEPQINYKGNIKGGNLEILLGSSIQNSTTENQSITAIGFKSDALLRSIAAATNLFASNSLTQYKYFAVFGRLNYNWANKYILNLNIRRDGSSRFGPGNQFGTFGSIGAAWIFSDEQFIQKALPFITFGKARFSYGTSGNDAIGDYNYLERYQPIVGLQPYQGAIGYRSNGLFNPYYRWEVTKKLEFGLETGFINDRLLLSFSYFRNRSNNQLLSYPTPSIAGPGGLLYNLPALIQNSGLEITMNATMFKSKDLNWSMSFNFTRNRNKLIKYPDLEKSPYLSYEIGEPFTGIVRVFSNAGVDPNTGRYQFKDREGKVTLTPDDPTRPNGGKYLTVMVDPKFYGGFSNSISYKGLSFDLYFSFMKRHAVNPISSYLLTAGYLTNLPSDFLSRWREAGDDSQIQKVSAIADNDLSQSADKAFQSTFNYVDASFLRLKTLAIAYTLPGEWKQRLQLNNVRIYVQGQNIWTLTKYKGLDPETRSMLTLPSLRVITIGLNVTL